MTHMGGTRVVMTGGQGFIGRHVARLLADTGAELVAPHRPDRGPLPGLPGKQLPLDLHDAEQLAGVLREGDLLVHLAARSGGIQFQESFEAVVFDENQRITRNVLEAARRAGVRRLFLASSAVIYSGDNTGPFAESARLVTPFHDRVSGYAWSKVTDEVLAAWFAAVDAFEVVIGRFTSVYGPGGAFDPARSTVVHSLVRKAVDAGPGGRLEVWGTGNAVRSFLHVDDAARAVVTVLRRGQSGQAYNVDASEPVTIRELARIVRDAVDPGLDLVFDAARPEGVRYRVLDNRKLRALGFAPATALETGVKATVEDYRARSARLRALE
jgi:GDP-L-fucose synthase